MINNERSRENRARRVLAKQGLRLCKCRSRNGRDPSHGNFHIIDAARNAIVAGGSPWAYSMSLEDVEVFIAGA